MLTLTATRSFHARIRHRYDLRSAAALAIAIHIALFVLVPPFWDQAPAQQPPQRPPIEILNEPRIEIVNPRVAPEPPVPNAEIMVDPKLAEIPIPPVPPPARPVLPGQTAGTSGLPRSLWSVNESEPVLIETVLPEYPFLAREAGIEGTVVLRVLVGEDGRALSAVVLRSDVTPAMEKAAIDAATRCRFRPARQHHIPVAAFMELPFEFRLEG